MTTRAANDTTAARASLFIVFEGIDGSGKTTISNRVAGALRARGLTVEHAREGGAFASSVTQGIRDFCRDARNLALVPRAELLLYVAREAQLLEEVLVPALGRADVVIADRYLYTAEVLARAGRNLPDEVVQPIIETAAHGLWPELALLIDVDPSVARGRRKVAKILSGDRRPASRKGLTGSGLQQRLREGYRALAARDPGRWVVVDNSDADLEQVIAGVLAEIERVRARLAGGGAHGAEAAPIDLPPRAAAEAGTTSLAGTALDAAVADGPRTALAALLEWVDRRSAREPLLAAYVLAGMAGAGVDERRASLAGRAPRVIARGLRGLSDAASWQLRQQLIEAAPNEIALSLVEDAAEAAPAWTMRELLVTAAPAEVAASLTGLDDETAWALRAELYPQVPDAVVGSLALLDVPRAWELRELWIAERGGLERAVAAYPGARAAARSVTGVDGERAWAVRKAARAHAPVAAIAALRGLAGEKAWRWRDRALPHAPKAVLSTIIGLDDERAWMMRVAAAPHCREVLDSMIGLDHAVAWEIREGCLALWPPSVVKSLGVLVSGARGGELLRRALDGFPDNISLLKQAALIATGASLTAPVMAA
jgi:dTMP kinase